MSRRAEDDGGSLELLLDTICNTFGGIVFISILVVMLLNFTQDETLPRPPDPELQREVAAWRQRLLESEEELRRLRDVLESQRQLSETFASDETKGLLQDLNKLQRELVELSRQQQTIVGQLADSQQEISAIVSRVEKVKRQLLTARQQLAATKVDWDRERQLRSRTTRLPRTRMTKRQRLVFFLEQGRLVALEKLESGKPVPDRKSFQTGKDQAGTFIEPRAQAGVVLVDQGQLSSAALNQLKSVDPQQFYALVVVRPADFADWNQLQQHLVQQGIEYKLFPLAEGDRLYLTNQAADNRVQ